MITVSRLNEMQKEVVDFCVAKGWSGPGSVEKTFGDCMTLLASEVSEALEAYREWKFEDATEVRPKNHGRWCKGHGWTGPCPSAQCPLPKPEGVGSELADVLVRLLDDSDRYKFLLGYAYQESRSQLFSPTIRYIRAEPAETFGDYLYLLHMDIANANLRRPERGFPQIYYTLKCTCERFDINLEWEFNRKMEYNNTRAFRHGGKLL